MVSHYISFGFKIPGTVIIYFLFLFFSFPENQFKNLRKLVEIQHTQVSTFRIKLIPHVQNNLVWDFRLKLWWLTSQYIRIYIMHCQCTDQNILLL